jgi:hypothetical protein
VYGVFQITSKNNKEKIFTICLRYGEVFDEFAVPLPKFLRGKSLVIFKEKQETFRRFLVDFLVKSFRKFFV